MKKLILNLFLVLTLTLFSACSSSIKDRVLKSIKESPIANSYVTYNDKKERWYNFKDQEEEIKEKYLLYLDEIADYISNLELTEVEEDDFKGTTFFMIKVVENDHTYLLNVKHIGTETDYIKFSIDKNNEYYKLIDGDGKELTHLYALSENAPFNNISYYEYLDHEVK